MSLASIVIPVYQNAPDLDELFQRLSAVARSLPEIDIEFVVVDDGSKDDSFSKLALLASGDARIRVLRLSRNFGSNAALLAGLMQARGHAVCTLAADLQDPPELIPQMLAEWKAGSQVVIAARRSREDPFFSRVFASIFNWLFRLLVFPDFPREGFDFMLLDRQVVDVLCAMPEKHSYLFGQVMWVGFARSAIPYDRVRRARGRSAWTFARKVTHFIDAFTAFSFLPIRTASLLGFGLAGVGFAYAAFIVALRLLGDVPIQGFSTLIVVLTVSAGTQLIVTGLIGEYLWRVLEEVRPRPPFLVAARINAPPSAGLEAAENLRQVVSR